MEYQVWLMSRLSQWLDAEGLAVAVLNEIGDRAVHLGVSGNRASPGPLDAGVRADAVVAARQPASLQPTEPATSSGLDVLIERYHTWMVIDRGLAARTMRRYEITARRFLIWRLTDVAGDRRRRAERGGRDRVLASRTRPRPVVGFAQGSRRRAALVAALLARRRV